MLGRMSGIGKSIIMFACVISGTGALASSMPLFPAALQQQAAPASNAIARRVGTLKAINGTTLTIAAESGPEITANVQPNARMLRLPPGEKELKNAAPIQLQDLQVGDTVRVRGTASDDGKSISTLEVLVISRSTVDAVRDQIRQDWQKRGLGGLVSAVDSATGTVSISVMSFGGKKTIAVHSSANTVFRRYAPDSIKFEDAKPSSLAEIHPGDQLRARGNRNPDGTEFTAEEIVTGSFRNIAGTVNSVDASAGTLTVQDLLSKKSVQVKVAGDSQLHQLPTEIAQRLAARLKAQVAGAMPPGVPGAGAAAAPSAQGAQSGPGSDSAPRGPGGGMGGMRPGGAPDMQQLLNRLPSVALSDLHKGDAVMLVTTQGTAASPSTAITVLSGVEPILQAAPNATQAMMLTPWSLGGAPGGEGNQ